MTRMIPSTIHPSIKSAAERKLFYIIQDAPKSDSWICLHSLGLARHVTKRRGEIDFLLLTPKGIFILEVKGGRISRENGLWQFTDKYGVIHTKNEGPIEQANTAMFSLEKEIQKHFSYKRNAKFLIGFGVMFPDVHFDISTLEIDPRQIYDAQSRRKPISYFVEQLSEFWKERDSRNYILPTKEDIEDIANFLRGDFDLISSLAIQADEINSQIFSLENEQYAVLDVIELFPKPKILVQGGAGTGKTLLAIEVARREARKGNGDILLLCYNKLLACFIENKLKTESFSKGSRIVVKTIYSILNDLIESSSLAKEFKQKKESVTQDILYQKLYPEYGFLAMLENPINPYRSIVIDEAQDMMSQELFDIIDTLIEGGLEAGQWWAFCDVNNQGAVFGAFDEGVLARLEKLGHIYLLPTNRRNTKPIANETIMLTKPKVRAVANIDGIPVRYSWYDKRSNQSELLRKVMAGFLSEGIQASQITILSPRKYENSIAFGMNDPSLIQLTTQNIASFGVRNSVTFCSISAFKGLENDIIILTDIEGLETDWQKSVIYVGMSRARIGLHLLLSQSLQSVYQDNLRSWLTEQDSPNKNAAGVL